MSDETTIRTKAAKVGLSILWGVVGTLVAGGIGFIIYGQYQHALTLNEMQNEQRDVWATLREHARELRNNAVDSASIKTVQADFILPTLGVHYAPGQTRTRVAAPDPDPATVEKPAEEPATTPMPLASDLIIKVYDTDGTPRTVTWKELMEMVKAAMPVQAPTPEDPYARFKGHKVYGDRTVKGGLDDFIREQRTLSPEQMRLLQDPALTDRLKDGLKKP